MSVVDKLGVEGLAPKVRRRAISYWNRLRVNNPLVGRAVEAIGDKVRMDGMTFSVDSPNITRGHKSTLAFGLHEMEERALVRRWLPRDFGVIELVGGLGVVSCLANRRIADPTAHVVVEANPYMIPVLERNRDLNGCGFRIVNQAIAHGVEMIRLPIDPSFVGTNIDAVGESTAVVDVAATTLTKIANDAGIDRFSLISDIEGGEEQVIMTDLPQLGERVRFVMMELHPYVLGQAKIDTLTDKLVELGFTLKERLGSGQVFSVAYSR